MPQNSTRCWYWAGIRKYPNIRTITKTLSMLSDSSMTYPVRNVSIWGVPSIAAIAPAKASASATQTAVQSAASRALTTRARR